MTNASKTTSGFWRNHRFKVRRVLVPVFLPYVWLFFMGTGQPSQASAELDYLNGHGRRSACSTGAAGRCSDLQSFTCTMLSQNCK